MSRQNTHSRRKSSRTDNDSLIIILFLIFLYPLGVAIMWISAPWSRWVKILITIPLLFLLSFIGMFIITLNNGRLQTNNYHRYVAIEDIGSSIAMYYLVNEKFPDIITTTEQEISSSEFDICADLIPEWLDALPVDPSINQGKAISDCTKPYSTGYTIKLLPDRKFMLTAPKAELGEEIISVQEI